MRPHVLQHPKPRRTRARVTRDALGRLTDIDRAEKDARTKLIDTVREANRWADKYTLLCQHRGLTPKPRLSLPDFTEADDANVWAKEQGDLAQIEQQRASFQHTLDYWRSEVYAILNGA